MQKYRGLALAIAAAAMVVGLGGCKTYKLELAQKLETNMGGVIADPVVSEYVKTAGQEVASGNTAEQNLTFWVLNNDSFNHFGTPEGRIYVTKGLLRYLENGAQLRSVLAFEVALAEGGYLRKAEQAWAQKQQGADLFEWFTKIGGTGAVADDKAIEAMVAKAAELAADASRGEFAFDYGAEALQIADDRAADIMLSSPYDARQYLSYLRKYRQSVGLGQVKELSSYPVTESRIQNVDSRTSNEAFGAETETDRYREKVLDKLN